MTRKRSTGVLATIAHNGERKAVLQIRNSEDSYPGCAQVTFHGGLEKGEEDDFERVRDGLRREFGEEVRELFERTDAEPPTSLLERADNPPIMQVISRVSSNKRQVVTLLCELDDQTFYEQIKPLIESGVVKLVGKDDLGKLCAIDRSNPDHKKHGVGDELIGMHTDELEVVQSVLTK